jgi:ribonuclease P protein component
VRVHFAPSDEGDETVCVAYAVSRKVGGAVVRNRWRRRLRAIAAEAASELRPGNYLIGVSPDVVNLSFAELRERVVDTMRRASETSR